jgi:hypothetical protein
MPSRHSDLARKFAQRIGKQFPSGRFHRVLQKASPQSEQKDLAEPIAEFLRVFRKVEHAESLPKSRYDWEGNYERKSEQELSYKIHGTWAYPDAAVLGPFTCAFEFDREPEGGGVHFKEQLMKAAVHVLSGAYDACVFVYLLRAGSRASTYLADRSVYSRTLLKKLRDVGLYLSIVPKHSA